MGLFSNSPANGRSEPPRGRRRTDTGSGLAGGGLGGGGAGLSIVAPDLHITGDLDAEGVIKVEGRVTGAVRSGHQVIVAPGAVIEGDVETAEAIIGGEIRGNIRATERVELQPSSVIHGNVATRRLLIQEGGSVNGEISMEESGSAPLPAADAERLQPAP